MNIIQPSAEVLSLIIGKQKAEANKIYRKMNYCIFYSFDGINLVFNVLTKELLKLTAEEYELLQQDKIEFSSLAIPFIEKWFIVPDEFDEMQLNDQVYSVAQNVYKSNIITSYVILTTTDCNARCFYCYQLGAKRFNMTATTAVEVAEFIEKNSGGQEVKISWFGGEPLYNIDPIDIICEELNKRNVKFRSNMVSNAYLFNEKIVKRAKDLWNLKNVQITLDGTEEIYNSRKNYIYKNSESAYQVVLNNINLLMSANIRPVVRLNMDLDNKDNLYMLVDELYAKFKGQELFSIYSCPLSDNNPESEKNTPEYQNKLWNEYFIFEKYIEERFKSFAKKLKTDIRISCCMADNNKSVMILPDGKIGKCDHYVDRYIVGNITDGIVDSETVKKLKELYPRTSECRTCPYLPECRHLKVCAQYPIAGCQFYDRQRAIKNIEKSMKLTYENFSKSE